MWIENTSAIDVKNGHHFDPGPNSMLIQIADPAGWFPEPKTFFKETHRFEFLDADDEDGFPEEAKISDTQAAEIATLLRHALDNRMNVVVHCTAGLCRSGAVTEVGVILGLDDTEKFRLPNIRVKQKLMRHLGLI
jgi:predicted protein tyrosine phosphatase